MKKRIFSVLLSIALISSLFAGCDKEENVAEEQQVVEESDENFAIINDNVKVAQYKGLSIEGYNDTVTEIDIDSFIDYVMQYVYVPEEDIIAAEEVSDETEGDEASAETSEESTEETNIKEESEEAITEETKENEDETGKPTLTHKDLTDEIASQVSDGKYTTAEAYREYVKDFVAEQNESYFVENAKSQLFAQVIDNSELVNYSEADLKNYEDYANEYYAEYAEYLGVDMETFRKETMYFETEDEFTNFIQEEALSNLKTEYVISAIADKEGITVSDEEINSEIKNYIDNGYFSTEEEVLNYTTRDKIITNKKYYKVMDIIFENATITPYVAEPEQTSSDIIPIPESAPVENSESSSTPDETEAK